MSRKEQQRYLIPAAIEFVSFTFLLLGTLFAVVDLEKFTAGFDLRGFLFGLSTVFTVLFMLLTIRVVRRHRRLLPTYFSNTDRRNLRWLEFLCYGVIILELGWICTEYMEGFVDTGEAQNILSLFNALIIFFAAFQGMVQQSVSLSPEHYSPESEKDACFDESTIRTSTSLLLFNRLKDFMNESKPYLNDDLQLHDLARAIGETPRRLSLAIGAHGETNFKGFVNTYRVREAQRLIRTGSSESLTMLAIAFESGFRSKASFYSAFKRVSDCSPGEYRKSTAGKRGSDNTQTS